MRGACDDHPNPTPTPTPTPKPNPITLRRVYDQLGTMDAVAFLHRCLEPGSADLIVAADVTVYMRSLEGLMQGAEIHGRYTGDVGEI